jgi:hypothetical protein
MLDALINLPHFLISVRNALLPIPPAVPVPPTRLPATVTAVATRPHPLSQSTRRPVSVQPESPVISEPDIEADPSSSEGNGSEADLDSNSGDGSGVGSSWVSLQEDGSRPESPGAV